MHSRRTTWPTANRCAWPCCASCPWAPGPRGTTSVRRSGSWTTRSARPAFDRRNTRLHLLELTAVPVDDHRHGRGTTTGANPRRDLRMALRTVARRLLSRQPAAQARTATCVEHLFDHRNQRLFLFIARPAELATVVRRN